MVSKKLKRAGDLKGALIEFACRRFPEFYDQVLEELSLTLWSGGLHLRSDHPGRRADLHVLRRSSGRSWGAEGRSGTGTESPHAQSRPRLSEKPSEDRASLRRMASCFPDHAQEVFRAVLERPYFDLEISGTPYLSLDGRQSRE